MDIKQWNLYLVKHGRTRGTELGKIRPCLVIQNREFGFLGSSVGLPLTSNVNEDMFPLRVMVKSGSAGLLKNSDILIDQIRAYDETRFISHLGELPLALIKDVKSALREFLEL